MFCTFSYLQSLNCLYVSFDLSVIFPVTPLLEQPVALFEKAEEFLSHEALPEEVDHWR